MRVSLDEFQSGAYADMLDSLPWNVLKVAAKLANRKDSSTDEETDRANDLTLKVMVRSWNVKDLLGADVPKPADATPEQLDMVDGFIIAKLLSEAINLAKKGKPDPNSETASSTS